MPQTIEEAAVLATALGLRPTHAAPQGRSDSLVDLGRRIGRGQDVLAGLPAAGGVWVDTAVAGSEQARSVAINRIVGGNPPTAAQFNTSKQFLDVVEQGMLNNVDEVAARDGWDKFLPETVLQRRPASKGHYYAVPVRHPHADLVLVLARRRSARRASRPSRATMDELFAALDKLKAAGLMPLAHGGQPWQENIVFTAVLANVGGTELYLKVLRDRDARAIQSDAFRKVLLTYKRLQSYVDAGSPGRNWNDATAMLITGKAGVQIMGDWAKGEFAPARQVAGQGLRLHRRVRAQVARTSSRATCSSSPRPTIPSGRRAQKTAGRRDAGARGAGGLQQQQGLDSRPHRRRRRRSWTSARSRAWPS